MDATLRKGIPRHKLVMFISGVLCIAAVGLSSYFFERQRKDREKRFAAENRLKTLTSELQLLRERNRELAEQLREAKRIATELVREKEGPGMAATEVSPASEIAAGNEASEGTTAPRPQEGASLAEAVNALRLDKAALAANRIGESAGEAWRAVRSAVTSSVRLVRSQGSPATAEKRKLADVMKIFPADAFVRLAAKGRSSVRNVLGSVGALFSSTAPTSAAVVSRQPSPPFPGSRKVTATDEELRTELAAVRQEKRELEREIAERTGKIADSVDVGRVRITTGRRFSGKVLVVNRKHNFVVIDIGKNQGLEKGEVLIVHRASKFIGKTRVIKVYDKMAAADLVMDWMQDEVRVSDGVKKF